MINLIREADTTHSGAGSKNEKDTTRSATSLPVLGDLSSYVGASYDGNWSNPFYGTVSSGGSSGWSQTNNTELYSIHTFPKPYNINQLKYHIRLEAQANASGNNHRQFEHYYYVELLINGIWTRIVNYSMFVTGGRYGGGTNGNWYTGDWQIQDTGVVTNNNLYSNVSGIRVWAKARANSGGGESWITRNSRAYIYEIEAFGEKYIDSGIRVAKNDSIMRIGCETLNSSHKLRFAKNGVVWGIPLLSTSDSNSSGVFIKDNTNVKALPQIL